MTADRLRAARNSQAMASERIDALICRLPENVLLLTGYWPLSGFAYALVPLEGPTTLIAPELDARLIPSSAPFEVITYRMGVLRSPDPFMSVQSLLRDALAAAGLTGARLGYEGNFEVVAAGHTGGEIYVPAARTLELLRLAAPSGELIDATPALHRARARKTPAELEKLRLANEIATFGLEAFRTHYQPGRTEAEVAAQVEAAIMTRGIGHRGAQRVRAWAQLMSGPESAFAYTLHPATSARVIQSGDLGVLELGTHVDGYWSDLTRTLIAGPPQDDRIPHMYEALLAAHSAVMAGAETGMSGEEVDALARGAIERRGLGALFNHPTGHGLGFRYHEPHPLLAPGCVEAVEEGMVTSVEPGLYVPGLGGMRLEENVVFTEAGVELLSHFPRTLQAN